MLKLDKKYENFNTKIIYLRFNKLSQNEIRCGKWHRSYRWLAISHLGHKQNAIILNCGYGWGSCGKQTDWKRIAWSYTMVLKSIQSQCKQSLISTYVNRR